MAVFVDQGFPHPGLVTAENIFLNTGPLGEPADDPLIKDMWVLGLGTLSGGSQGLSGLANTIKLLTADPENQQDREFIMGMFIHGNPAGLEFAQLLQANTDFAGYMEILNEARAEILAKANQHLNSRAELILRGGLANQFTLPPEASIDLTGEGLSMAIKQLLEAEQWEPASQALSHLRQARKKATGNGIPVDYASLAAARATLRFGILGPLAEKLAWYFGRGANGFGMETKDLRFIRGRNVPKALIFRSVYGFLAQENIACANGKDYTVGSLSLTQYVKAVVQSVALDYAREGSEGVRMNNEGITNEFLNFLAGIRCANKGSLLEL